jgi:hypothetical protein
MRQVVLDHGYVELVESWGSEERIVEAARMSTAKGFLGWGDADQPGDEKLLRYLYEHKHDDAVRDGGPHHRSAGADLRVQRVASTSHAELQRDERAVYAAARFVLRAEP